MKKLKINYFHVLSDENYDFLERNKDFSIVDDEVCIFAYENEMSVLCTAGYLSCTGYKYIHRYDVVGGDSMIFGTIDNIFDIVGGDSLILSIIDNNFDIEAPIDFMRFKDILQWSRYSTTYIKGGK